MFGYKRVFVLIIGVNFVVILFYINYRGVHWSNQSSEQFNVLEVESLERLINHTIPDESDYETPEPDIPTDVISGDPAQNLTDLSPIDRELLELEDQLFSSDYSGPTTEPVDTQLFYADYVKYVKEYTISKSDYCVKHPNLTTIVFVWSRVNGCEQRNAIRQTWANQTYTDGSSVKLLFVIGSNDNQTDMDQVLAEDRLYDDILQFQLMDSYHNCTLKSIGVLRWTQFFCKNIKYLMKTDDDIVVNINNLDNFVEGHLNTPPLTIYGILAKHWNVNRNKQSKWYISRETYRETHFPDFIVAAHLMTRDSVSVLYEKCLQTLPAFWLEDVYITGILANGTAVQRHNLDKFVKLDWLKKHLSKDIFDRNICIGHDLSARYMLKFWANYTKPAV